MESVDIEMLSHYELILFLNRKKISGKNESNKLLRFGLRDRSYVISTKQCLLDSLLYYSFKDHF
jgi:hypothetical protein